MNGNFFGLNGQFPQLDCKNAPQPAGSASALHLVSPSFAVFIPALVVVVARMSTAGVCLLALHGLCLLHGLRLLRLLHRLWPGRRLE